MTSSTAWWPLADLLAVFVRSERLINLNRYLAIAIFGNQRAQLIASRSVGCPLLRRSTHKTAVKSASFCISEYIVCLSNTSADAFLYLPNVLVWRSSPLLYKLVYFCWHAAEHLPPQSPPAICLHFCISRVWRFVYPEVDGWISERLLSFTRACNANTRLTHASCLRRFCRRSPPEGSLCCWCVSGCKWNRPDDFD